eukprot:11535944-Alexandrium_andersonii.AAC.1
MRAARAVAGSPQPPSQLVSASAASEQKLGSRRPPGLDRLQVSVAVLASRLVVFVVPWCASRLGSLGRCHGLCT